MHDGGARSAIWFVTTRRQNRGAKILGRYRQWWHTSFPHGIQEIDSGFSSQIGLCWGKLSDRRELSSPQNQGEQCSFVLFRNYGVNLSITYQYWHNCVSDLDDHGSRIFSCIFMGGEQMAVKGASFGLIVENILRVSLMADREVMRAWKEPRDLSGTRIFLDELLN